MDKIDKAILEILEENAKLGTKEIASQIGLTVTPTYERIKRLEKAGVIKRYTVELDSFQIGKGLQIFCYVTLKEHKRKTIEEFESKVMRLAEITACYHIAGNHDYALHIRVSDMVEYENFLRDRLATLPSIANVQSSFVMREIEK